MREVNGGFLAGAEDGFERVKERMLDFTAAGRESVGQLAGSVHGSFEDAFVAVTMNTKKAKAAFHDMTRAILSDISRIIARLITMAIWNAIAGGGGSKIPAVGNMSTTWDEHPEGAHGGWFDESGWHGETGPRNRLAAISRTADVRRFAEGGVVTRPTLGLFGEAGPEAFVPLRAGRIPVEMRGQGAGQATVINLTIQAVDASSVERLFHEHGDKLAEVIQGKLGTNRGLINAVRRRT